jgi:hypothetical protein
MPNLNQADVLSGPPDVARIARPMLIAELSDDECSRFDERMRRLIGAKTPPRSHRPPSYFVSQIRTSPSAEAEASRAASGLKATPWTRSL